VHNYPDNWSWSAYDDHHDPKLQCGHHLHDGCDCWCEWAFDDKAHAPGECTSSNCRLASCKHCGEAFKNADRDEPAVCAYCSGEEE